MAPTNRLNAISQLIKVIRNQRVIIDSDLAKLYDVQTKALLQAVKRNHSRFPDDFAFRLTKEEFLSLRSQIVTSNSKRGGRRSHPIAFTEQGIAMLSSILRSEKAILVNIEIMRTFVQMKRIATNYAEFEKQIKKWSGDTTKNFEWYSMQFENCCIPKQR